MKKNKQSNNLKYIFLCGLFLLSFIFFTIFISSTLFIVKIPINSLTIFISLLLSTLLNIYLSKKNLLKKKKYILYTILLPILIIFSSIFISSLYYDSSYDGNNYHKLTIGHLANGWNPIYESVDEFTKRTNIEVGLDNNIWIEHYAMGIHIFDANIYKITNNIEQAKCINILTIILTFLLLFPPLYKKTNKKSFSTLFILAIITYPTIISQLTTLYIDLLVYLFFFILIGLLFMKERSNLLTDKEYNIIYFFIITIGINIKFSLFAYMGLYCLGYYIYKIIQLKKNKKYKNKFIDFTLVSITAVIIGVFVIGLSIYPKNYLDHGNPFYPLAGNDKIDIMTTNQPELFNNKSPLYKYVVSTLSESSNPPFDGPDNPILKIPFLFSLGEIRMLSIYDLRIAGNGVWYSGLLILSIITLLILLPKTYKKDKELFILMIIPLSITILLIIFLNESWWARYFPPQHIIEILAIYLLFKENSLYKILLGILLINNIYPLFMVSLTTYERTNTFNEQFNQLISQDCNPKIYMKTFYGALYNIKDKLPDKNIKYVDLEDEYPKEFNPLMGNKMYWSCEK